MLKDPARQIHGLADIIDLASPSVSEPIETRFIGWGLSARPPSAKDAHCNSSYDRLLIIRMWRSRSGSTCDDDGFLLQIKCRIGTGMTVIITPFPINFSA